MLGDVRNIFVIGIIDDLEKLKSVRAVLENIDVWITHIRGI